MKLPPTCRRVYLVRHAESERIGAASPMDPDLTARGVAQLAVLRELAASLSVDAIVCSELVRARRTAEAIASAHGLVPSIDAGWNEFHTVGAWREHSHREIDELIQARFYRPDDRRAIGESLRDIYRRSVAAWERLLATPSRSMLVVSHNGVIGTLVPALLGLREDVERSAMISYPHAAITELWLFDRDHDPSLPGRITVAMRIADASHLPPDLVTR
jgi:broad specificity phosphatase PhoE